VLPAFKALLEELIAPESREILHCQAAEIWAARGAYTEAAYHYLKARRPTLAVQLWYEHRREEIDQGQAGAALRLFADLARDMVHGADREKLILLRSELWKLAGDYGRAREDLRADLWRTPILHARARRLEGDMAEVTGDFDRAQRAYQDGLQTVETALESEVAQFHKNLGWVEMRRGNLEQAWREALLARYEAVNLQGYVQDQLGQYAAARSYYQEALALAETLHHAQGEAKTRRNLATLLAQQGDFSEAEAHWQAASRHFERIENLTSLASIKVNQAFIYNLAGQPQAALTPAGEALSLFEQLGQAYGRSVAAQNLAEAHLALGNLSEAERFARRVIQEEERVVLPDGLRVLGEIKLAQGDLTEARALIQQSIDFARKNQDQFLEAYSWRALGRVYQAMGDREAAQSALAEAMHLFETLVAPEEVARTRAVALNVA
jgi:tetratricopeptide (TPR) repeat protein